MQQKTLRNYFPMLKTKEEILTTIHRSTRMRREFSRWKKEQQDDFLNFCSGAKGVKILYDAFFKEILHPEYTPERLNWLLSVILGMKVSIVKVLPLDTTRMGSETSLVSMDIVVELEDGSLVNVEMQRIGYLFPGQRSACYSSDLLLRQYKRVRSTHQENHTKFRYSDIKPVYTIVFFETSPSEFQDYPTQYIHYCEQVADTGLRLELLQKYIFISLDIFHKVRNNFIESELDAWLTFLSSDDVEDIIRLIEQYPAFKPLYETLYQMCENIEEVMGMFSEELYELDKNTYDFMVDEFGRIIEEQKGLIAEMNDTIAEKATIIAEKDNTIAEKDHAIAEKDNIITEKDNTIAEKDNTIAERDAEIKRLQALLKSNSLS